MKMTKITQLPKITKKSNHQYDQYEINVQKNANVPNNQNDEIYKKYQIDQNAQLV